MILIVNENGSDNIGDHAINEGLKSVIERGCKSFQCSPFSTTRSDSNLQFKNIEDSLFKKNNFIKTKLVRIIKLSKFLLSVYWLTKNFSRVKKAVSKKSVDTLLIGGGQLILSGSSFPIAMFTWIFLAAWYKKRIFLVGVGCGENFSSFEAMLLKVSLKRAKAIYVRELESIEKLSKFFGLTASYCPDLAFGLVPVESANAKSNRIVVGVTDFEVHQRYLGELSGKQYASKAEYIKSWQFKLQEILKDTNAEVVFASTTIKDITYNSELYETMLLSGVSNKLTNITQLQSLEDYRKLLASSNIVFSGRMHSLILGKIEGCEIIPWLVSKKIELFLKNYSGKKPAKLLHTIESTVRGLVL